MKQDLEQQFEVLGFLGLTQGSPVDVYRWDIEGCVASADLFVAMCDYPSTGLGLEIGAALWRYDVPTLGLASVESKVTRIILGVGEEADQELFTFQRYNDHRHAVELVLRFADSRTQST